MAVLYKFFGLPIHIFPGASESPSELVVLFILEFLQTTTSL